MHWVPWRGARPGQPRPALSPAGQALAFVHASAAGPPSQTFGQPAIAAWYATRGLWVYPLGGNPHLVSGAGAAIADPTWSADGKLLLYVRGDDLWLINPFTGQGNPPTASHRPPPAARPWS